MRFVKTLTLRDHLIRLFAYGENPPSPQGDGLETRTTLNEKPVEHLLDGSYHLIFVLSPVFAGEANYLVHRTIPQIAVYNLLKHLSTLEFTL